MRKIEKQIINYLRDSANCGKSKDLSPRDSVGISKGSGYVSLWGHCIFTVDRKGDVKFSFQGWQTNTTKSRIDALLSAFCSAGIYQKKQLLIFSSAAGEFPIYADKIYTIRNGKPEEVESI